MGIREWVQSMRKKNQGFVYKLDPEEQQQPESDKTSSTDEENRVGSHYDKETIEEYMEAVNEDEIDYEEGDDEEFDKVQFMQRSVPIDHIIKMCISTLYDDDGDSDEYEDVEYAYFLANYKVSSIIEEYKAGRIIDDIKCIQLTGDDMGDLFDYCTYEEDDNSDFVTFSISSVNDDWYDEYRNLDLASSYQNVHEEIRALVPAEMLSDDGKVKIVSLVQLANGLSISANQQKSERIDALKSEKDEVCEFFS